MNRQIARKPPVFVWDRRLTVFPSMVGRRSLVVRAALSRI